MRGAWWLPRRAHLWFIRCFVLTAALQFSGLLHDVPDLLRSVAGLADFASDGCPDEERGGRCPPDCLTCHCAAEPATLPPSVIGSLVPAITETTFGFATKHSPQPEHQDSVYRPPRDRSQPRRY